MGGCDTLAILTLVVQDPLPPTHVYDTICANDSILFNGVYIDTTGTYTGHFSNTTGCDSMVILRLTVKPLPIVTISRTCDVAGMYECWWSASFTARLANYDSVKWMIDGVVNPRITSDTLSFINNIRNFNITLPETIDTIDMFSQHIFSVTAFNACGSTTVTDTIQLVGEGINEISLNNSITLYPNPAIDQLYIKTENIQPQSITLYDVDGRLIYTQPFKPEIDINQLSNGVYFIEVMSNEGVARKRFVKM